MPPVRRLMGVFAEAVGTTARKVPAVSLEGRDFGVGYFVFWVEEEEEARRI